ncbi:hypothetical protein ENUP19_0059G0006 [Entamoeba nuttalli]|uniref:dUTP diphosphatase n=1 Tax=Entamoeba nuttalli TaxID=412467 RepID=A0ABQ0DD61_9EUKA
MSWGSDSSKTFKNTSTDHKMYIFQFMFMINTDTDSTKKTKIRFKSDRIDSGNSSTIDKLADRDKYYSNGYMIFTTREYVSTVGVYILNYTDGTLTYKNAVDIVQSSPNQSFIYYIDSKTPFDELEKQQTIQALIEYFNKENVGIIEEYIDYSPRIGKMLISDVGNGIERNYTLQKFILQLIIIERHPREAIEVFCEIDKTMTEKEREEIRNKIYLIEKEYQLEYNKFNTYCISTDYTTPNDIARNIFTEWVKRENIENESFHVFLYANEENQKKRIIKRNRGVISEMNFYYVNQINTLYKHYLNEHFTSKENNEETLFIKKLHKDAIIPTRRTEQSVGFDLYCIDDNIIYPHDRCLISTGIAVQIPHFCYGRVAPRSSLAIKYGIDIGGGVIDEDYRGEIKKGDRVAQLIIEKVKQCKIEEVKEISETIRGEKGFGSTGK